MSTTNQGEGEGNESPVNLADAGDNIDLATFEQVLEMDDDEEEREFSKSIVLDFFVQAESTFDKIETSLEDRDLPALSGLGHFLKGSSATLGLTKLRDSCEKIQHFGAKKDESGSYPVDDDDTCLRRIRETLRDARSQFSEVERFLRRFYHEA